MPRPQYLRRSQRYKNHNEKTQFESDSSGTHKKTLTLNVYFQNRMKISASSTRSANLELLRIVAMAMIVMIHILGKGELLHAPDLGTANRAGFWLLETLSIVAVNCYVLISGYFLSRSTFRLGKYLRLWSQVFFYSVTLYLLYAAFAGDGFSERQFYASCFPILTTRYWYVSAYAALYIVSPGLNFLIRNASQRFLTNTMLTLLLLFSLWSWLWNPFFVMSGYSMLWFCMLYLTAGYIRRYATAARPASRYFRQYLLLSLGTYLLQLAIPAIANETLYYNAPLVYLASVALFLCFRRLTVSDRWQPLILRLSGLTFGVYLIHEHPQLQTLLYATFDFHAYAASPLGIPYAIGCGLLIYSACSIAESLRRQLFGLLRIEPRLDQAAQSIDRRWDHLQNRIFPKFLN